MFWAKKRMKMKAIIEMRVAMIVMRYLQNKQLLAVLEIHEAVS